MAKDVKVISTEILSNFFFPLKKVKFEMEMMNGAVEEVNREVYCSKNGVTALLYNTERSTVILTRQFRLPAFLNNLPTGMLIETCAGLVEDNEDPKEGIIREIEEETGYKIESAKKYLNFTALLGQ